MKKKRETSICINIIIGLSFSILLAPYVNAQNYYISFAANGGTSTIDSIKVENITQISSLTLLGGDILHLTGTTGINNLSSNDEFIRISPNPMEGQAEIIFNSKQAGIAHLFIYDFSGKKVIQLENNILQGVQQYQISGLRNGIYFICINGENYSYEEKLISLSNSQDIARLEYIGIGDGVNNYIKLTKSTIDMLYSIGDSLRYTGYSGGYNSIVNDVPTTSKTITFTFVFLPTVTTTPPSNIEQTTAKSGGSITDDGGGAITAKGVCWSTSPNPLITGSHTTNGTGTNSFNSYLSGLSDTTTYYIRAYATNSAGTAYGNELTFTTLQFAIPSLTTTLASNITQYTASSGGNIISDGGYAVTTSGICWSTNTNPTVLDNYTTDGTVIGNFASCISGLSQLTTYYVRAYATNSLGTAYGNEISFTTTDICFICGTSTVTDIDGNVYNTVSIGSQCWLLENLNTTKYRNGNAIPNVTDNTTWCNLTTGAYCDYENNPGNSLTYGRLYNWYAVSDSSNLCPVGWHVPSYSEWTILWNYGGYSNTAGNRLKEAGTTHWHSPNTGATNSTGFTALPGGGRQNSGTDCSGSFDDITYCGFWWSSTTDEDEDAWYLLMRYDWSQVSGMYIWPELGMSVRCIRD